MKTSKNSLKAQNIGPSSSVCALMVKIDWTTSQVVKITARQDFQMAAVTMDTKNSVMIAEVPVTVLAGTELYFVASSIAGYYYIARVSAAGRVACTCPQHQARHACKHQQPVADRRAGIVRRPAAEWKAMAKREREERAKRKTRLVVVGAA